MVISSNKETLTNINLFTKNSCIDIAIRKQGKSLKQIKEEIEVDKQKENDVLQLHEKGNTVYHISKKLGIKLSDVKWIIKSDNHNLSYRAIAKKYN